MAEKLPSCVNLAFSVAAPEVPSLNTRSVSLFVAEKVASASAVISAATVTASPPLASFTALN